MKQSPELFVTAKYDVSASPSVTAVGTTLRREFISAKMNDAISTIATATEDFYIIDKIRFSH